MSFILDALRKSDQQRQRNVTPTLMTAQTPAAEPRQPALWGYGLLAGVLIGAGILIGWMHQWQAEPAAPLMQPTFIRPLDSNAQKFSAAHLPVLPEPPKQAEYPQPPREATSLAQSATPPSGPNPQHDTSAKPAMAAGEQTTAVTSSPRVATPSVPAVQSQPGPGEAERETGVMALTELPPALQQEIPKLSILAHSYSGKSKSRFVFINDRMWREEEFPVPGLKLEQITPDGMIFSYKGYRFRRGANP